LNTASTGRWIPDNSFPSPWVTLNPIFSIILKPTPYPSWNSFASYFSSGVLYLGYTFDFPCLTSRMYCEKFISSILSDACSISCPAFTNCMWAKIRSFSPSGLFWDESSFYDSLIWSNSSPLSWFKNEFKLNFPNIGRSSSSLSSLGKVNLGLVFGKSTSTSEEYVSIVAPGLNC